MRYARVFVADTPEWTALHGNMFEVLDGPPYSGGQPTGIRLPADEMRLAAPATPSKIFCLGRNYADHRAAMGYQHHDSPSIFMKGPSTIIGPGEHIVLPPLHLSSHVEHEAELAVVIGATARNVRAADADGYIFGYTCANDVSARDLQRSDPHPTRAKGFDTFCPIGPWIETELDPAAGISLRCTVNGELRQNGSTADMTHAVPELIEYLSGFATLHPGDLILTGSPGGTAPIYPGDRIDIGIDGIGILTNTVVGPPATPDTDHQPSNA